MTNEGRKSWGMIREVSEHDDSAAFEMLGVKQPKMFNGKMVDQKSCEVETCVLRERFVGENEHDI